MEDKRGKLRNFFRDPMFYYFATMSVLLGVSIAAFAPWLPTRPERQRIQYEKQMAEYEKSRPEREAELEAKREARYDQLINPDSLEGTIREFEEAYSKDEGDYLGRRFYFDTEDKTFAGGLASFPPSLVSEIETLTESDRTTLKGKFSNDQIFRVNAIETGGENYEVYGVMRQEGKI